MGGLACDWQIKCVCQSWWNRSSFFIRRQWTVVGLAGWPGRHTLTAFNSAPMGDFTIPSRSGSYCLVAHAALTKVPGHD